MELSQERQAGAGENLADMIPVEITPEMIRAGIDELLEYCPEQDEAKLVVRWIFEAMMRAQAGP